MTLLTPATDFQRDRFGRPLVIPIGGGRHIQSVTRDKGDRP